MLLRPISQKIAVPVVYVTALFMTIMDITIVNVALPALGKEFGVESAAVNGVVIFYIVALAVIIPVSGWLGDRFGGRIVLLGSVFLFISASALCGLANSLNQLELFRAFQGIAGGLMVPVGMAMLWRVFPPADRVGLSAILVIPTALAPALGPLLGGYFVTHLSWRWVFFVNIPIGMVALIFGGLYLSKERLEDAGVFDVMGFLLASAGFGFLMYGVSQGPINGWNQPEILVTCAAGTILLVSLVVIQLKHSDPLLKLRLFSERLFGLCNLVMLLGRVSFMGTMYIVSLFYQDGLGLDALQAGLSIFPEALGVMVGSQVIAKSLYPVIGPRRIVCASLILNAAIMMGMILVGPTTNLWFARVLLFMLGFGMSGVFIPIQAAAFATTSHKNMGGATTLLNIQQQIGGAIGVALMTAIFVNVDSATNASATARHVTNLFGYRMAFASAAVIALIGAGVALFIRDADAASTITRWRG